jgi:hypothetical protein
MSLDVFEKAALALKDFPTESPPPTTVKNKIVGILGGEPLIHPRFREICILFEEIIPYRDNRGLWTGLKWERSKYAEIIKKVFGYINNNRHETECKHSPILVSIESQIKDEEERKKLIDKCWLQEMWSGTITPKGFFFCEVAANFDLLMEGPGGLPIEPRCWERPLSDFQYQIDFACNKCGIPMQLEGRHDYENIDDISGDNLERIQSSVRLTKGRYEIYKGRKGGGDKQPWKYLQYLRQ